MKERRERTMGTERMGRSIKMNRLRWTEQKESEEKDRQRGHRETDGWREREKDSEMSRGMSSA